MPELIHIPIQVPIQLPIPIQVPIQLPIQVPNLRGFLSPGGLFQWKLVESGWKLGGGTGGKGCHRRGIEQLNRVCMLPGSEHLRVQSCTLGV